MRMCRGPMSCVWGVGVRCAAMLLGAAGAAHGGILPCEFVGWVDIGQPTYPDGAVYAFATFDDGSGPLVYAGGAIAGIDGAAAFGLVRSQCGRWAPVENGVQISNGRAGIVEALYAGPTSLADQTPALYVGGQFDRAGGVTVTGLAKYVRNQGAGQWVRVNGSITNGAGPTIVRGIAGLSTPGPRQMVIVGDFDGAGPTSRGIAFINDQTVVAPGSLLVQAMQQYRGCVTLDGDGPSVPGGEAVVIFGQAQVGPGVQTSSVQVYRGGMINELGTTQGAGWIRGDVHGAAAGDIDGAGPEPWRVYVCGESLFGGSETLAYFDAPTARWVALPVALGSTTPPRIDSITLARLGDPQPAQPTLYATAPNWTPGLLVYNASTQVLGGVQVNTPYGGVSAPVALGAQGHVQAIGYQNAGQALEALLVGGEFQAPLASADWVPSDWVPSALVPRPRNAAAFYGSGALVPVDFDLTGGAGGASEERLNPLQQFTSNGAFDAIGTYDFDLPGSGGPRRLVVHPRPDFPPGSVVQIGNQTAQGELFWWDSGAGAWNRIDGAFRDAGGVVGSPGVVNAIKELSDLLGDNEGELYAVGQFERVGSTPAANVAVYNRSGSGQWESISGGSFQRIGPFVKCMTTEVVSAVAPYPVPIVGGLLTDTGFPGGQATSGVAYFNDGVWGFLGTPSELGNDVRALAVWDRDGAGSAPAELYAASTSRTLVWTGSSWDPITPGLSNGTMDMAVMPLSNELIFVGRFPGIEESFGVPARVVRYNGLTREPVLGFPLTDARRVRAIDFAARPGHPVSVETLVVSGLNIPSLRGEEFVTGGIAILPSGASSWTSIAETVANGVDRVAMMEALDLDGDLPGPVSLVVGEEYPGYELAPTNGADLSTIALYQGIEVGTWSTPGSGGLDSTSGFLCGLVPGPFDYLTFDNNAYNPGQDNRGVGLPSSATLFGVRAIEDSTTIQMDNGADLTLLGSQFPRLPALVVGDNSSDDVTLGLQNIGGTSFVTAFGPVVVGSQCSGVSVSQTLSVLDGVTLLCQDDLQVGAYGTGGLLQVACNSIGASASLVSDSTFLGVGAGSEGEVSLLGPGQATWTTVAGFAQRALQIGVAGRGEVRVQSPGQVSGTYTDFSLGEESTGSGLLSVAGEGARVDLTVFSTDVRVGRDGDGRIEVSSGADVTFDQTDVKVGTGTGSGAVVVTGFGSTLQQFTKSMNSEIRVGGRGVVAALQGGEVRAQNVFALDPGGVLRGNGVVGLTSIGPGILNSGRVDPSASENDIVDAGTLLVDCDYQQFANGVLNLDLVVTPTLTSVDTLDVAGTARLAGRLEVRFAGGVQPEPGVATGVEILTASAIEGVFDVAAFPGLRPDPMSGAGRFLRYEVTPSTTRDGSGRGAFAVRIIEETLGGTQVISAPGQSYALPGSGTSGVLGDFDLDGDRDLAITVPDSSDPVNNIGFVIVLFNGGNTGTFWNGFTSSRQFPVGRNPSSVGFGDFDGDGNIDLAVTNGTDNDITIVRSVGDALSVRGGDVTVPVGLGPNGIETRDYDLDGRVDVGVSLAGEQVIRVLRNQGGMGQMWGGLGEPATVVITGEPGGTSTIDVDDDKFDDIVTPVMTTSSLIVTRNAGRPTPFAGARGVGIAFEAGVVIPIPGGPVDVAVGDLNLDGNADMVVALEDSGELGILVGNGTFEFTAPSFINAGTGPKSVTLADLDRDGDPDVAVVTTDAQGERVVRLFRNDLFEGVLNFAFVRDIAQGRGPEIVLSGDLTGDGADDLVTANQAGQAGFTTLAEADRGAPLGEEVSVFTFAACRGDADGDRRVDMKDIMTVLNHWLNDYRPGTGPGDADGSGTVGFSDVIFALSSFGVPCP